MSTRILAVSAVLVLGCGAHPTDEDGRTSVAFGSGLGSSFDVTTGLSGAELGDGDLTVLVLFDQSGSMAGPWEGGTKWEVANAAFEKGLVGILDQVTIGAILFPQPGGCDVAPLGDPMQFGFSSGRRFWSRWQETADTRSPDGDTPLELSFHRADEAIAHAATLGLLEQRFRVLLVSDGEPTCGDDESAIAEMVARWAQLGVETRVLGLPGSAPAAEQFDTIAARGGTEEHVPVEESEELDENVHAALR